MEEMAPCWSGDMGEDAIFGFSGSSKASGIASSVSESKSGSLVVYLIFPDPVASEDAFFGFSGNSKASGIASSVSELSESEIDNCNASLPFPDAQRGNKFAEEEEACGSAEEEEAEEEDADDADDAAGTVGDTNSSSSSSSSEISN